MKTKIIDIEAEFDGIEFDEVRIRKDTAAKKISDTLKGRKNFTEESKRKSKETWKNKSEEEILEYRKKLSDSLKGKIHSKESYQSAAEKNRGIKRTEEQRKKLSDAHKGYVHTKESNEKRSASLKGKIVKDETKLKLSKLQSKCIMTPYGPFASIKDIMVYEHDAFGKAKNYDRFTKFLKTENSGYYYITKEEYILLTGKDI
jgi:hypothetical protein